ncbi:MAG: hypothetical protein KBC45_08775 [Pseudomonas sp.]|uniref:hypothetical protein n=1 Tax=Pseudomonas sp. TaxID=306 RepID=UPI001B52B630|nr:hypothetical protein [Pseudomonas sp.]MBP6954502.1 hypothetical protein [Pseudomonas sp.]
MTTNQTIDGVPRAWLEEYESLADLASGDAQRLRALLDAPADTRTETVPKHKFDTLVQHCKRLDGEVAKARAHVNEITLYQQNAVWFWQHDGEDFLESLSCPIIIQPHHLRELLKGVVPAEQPAPVAVVLPERRDFSPQSDSEWGWNTCLDELKRLNPSL